MRKRLSILLLSFLILLTSCHAEIRIGGQRIIYSDKREYAKLLSDFVYTNVDDEIEIISVKKDSRKKTSLKVPSVVSSIKEGAFYGCSNLESLEMPFTGTNRNDVACFGSIFGENGFKNSYQFSNYYIPFNFREITVTDCSNLGTTFQRSYFERITLIGSIRIINEGAFYKCLLLYYVKLPDGLSTISARAFDECVNLSRVIIPKSIKFIGDYVFEECYSLQSIIYEGTMEDWSKVKFSSAGSSSWKYKSAIERIECIDGVIEF